MKRLLFFAALQFATSAFALDKQECVEEMSNCVKAAQEKDPKRKQPETHRRLCEAIKRQCEPKKK